MTDPVPSESSLRFMNKATWTYHKSLSLDAESYLINERGLTPETISRFRLGSVGEDNVLPGHEMYRGCLVIPYLTPDGKVVSVRFRNLSGTGSKYLTVTGDMPRIYNTSALEKGKSVIVVTEGEIDCMTAEQAGLHAIGIPGATSWQRVWRLLLLQYDTVFVLSDDDDAGRQFAKTVAKDLDNVRNIPMEGGDVNTFSREHGAIRLRQKVGING